VINASSLENMSAILSLDASLEKRVEHIGRAQDEEAVKDKGLTTNNEIEGWVCLR
jgi:hypothetical protein